MTTLRNATSNRSIETTTTPPMSSASRSATDVLMSIFDAVAPPTWTSAPVPLVAAGITSSRSFWTRSSVAASCGPVLGTTVISAVSPAGLSRAGDTAATPAVLPSSACSRGRAEVHAEEWCGQHEQQRDARHGGEYAVPSHQPAPPRPAGRWHQVAVGGDLGGATPSQRHPEPVDAPPQVAQQRGEQGDGGNHHDQSRHHGDDGGAVYDGQAHREQPQHAHHDRATGHEDRTAGGVERRHGRRFGV